MRFSFSLSLNSRLTIDRNSLSAWVWSLWQQTRPAENTPTVGVSRAGKTSGKAEACHEDYTLLSQYRGIHDPPRWRSFSSVLPSLAGRAEQHQQHNRQGRVPHLASLREGSRTLHPCGKGLGSPVLGWMHYVRQGSFVRRDGTNIAAGRLCTESQRGGGTGRKVSPGAGLPPRGWGSRLGSGLSSPGRCPWHALLRVGCLRRARGTNLGHQDWHEDRSNMEGLLSPMRTKVGKDVRVFWSSIYSARGRGVAGRALWIGGLSGFCLFSFLPLFFLSYFSKLCWWM